MYSLLGLMRWDLGKKVHACIHTQNRAVWRQRAWSACCHAHAAVGGARAQALRGHAVCLLGGMRAMGGL
jgi:hypothetical protein